MVNRHKSIVILAILGLSGCSPTPRTTGVAVSGHVTYQGVPIADGMIIFSPPPELEGKGGMSRITNGNYSIGREDGPMPGEQVVRIHGLQVMKGEGNAKVLTSVKIPKTYNDETTLRIKIPKRNSMEYSFNLE